MGRAALILVLSLGLSAAAVQADCPSGDLPGSTARCDAGDGEACAKLGAMYRTDGQGVVRDEPRALELYRKGCSLGSTSSCTSFREMYGQGRGVKGEPGEPS